MKNQTQGFTLIEISIVLVIIGLLAGGILKGQQMIENARYKSLVKEIDSIRIAFNAFQDRYRYYPGDFNRATTMLNVTSNIPLADGNGNGILDHASGLNAEPVQAYLHLLAAGLIKGDVANIPNNGSYLLIPSAAGSGFFSGFSSYVMFGKRKHWINYHNMDIEFVQRYDEEFDDGKADSGDVVCNTVMSTCTGAVWPSSNTTISTLIAF